MTRYTRHIGSDAATIEMAHAVRRRVFIEEQDVAEELEIDGQDEAATHVVLMEAGAPVATARLRFPELLTTKVERVAVLPEYRGEGLGTRVMDIAETVATGRGAATAVLHAQRRVEEFYGRIGYERVSDTFEEAGIPHVEMRKRLD